MVKVQTHKCVTRVEAGEEDGSIGLRTGVRLHVCILSPKELANAVNRELFDLINNLAATVVAMAGVAFSVLVGEDGAHSLHDLRADEVFGCYELDTALLAGTLIADELENSVVSFHISYLNEFYFSDILFVVAVMAADDALLLVGDMEEGFHGFIVGDALGIIASHDAVQFIGQAYLFLFHDLVVTNDGKGNIWSHDGQLVEFLVGEEPVGYLNDALRSHFLGLEVEADGNLRCHLLQVK